MIIDKPIFQRCALLTINDLIIDSKDYNFNFEYNYAKDNSISELTIVINNLGKNIEKEIKKDLEATFSFGYNNDLCYFLSGTIKNVRIKNVNGIDRTAYIVISEVKNISKLYKTISKSYAAGTTAKSVILDLAVAAVLVVNTIDLLKNIVYNTGIQRYGTPLTEIRKIVASCGSFIKIDGNILNIFHEKSTTTLEIIQLGFDSGL